LKFDCFGGGGVPESESGRRLPDEDEERSVEGRAISEYGGGGVVMTFAEDWDLIDLLLASDEGDCDTGGIIEEGWDEEEDNEEGEVIVFFRGGGLMGGGMSKARDGAVFWLKWSLLGTIIKSD